MSQVMGKTLPKLNHEQFHEQLFYYWLTLLVNFRLIKSKIIILQLYNLRIKIET
jgi:hypothetical protein